MIRDIITDELFLSQKSELATAKDKKIAIDLQDTLRFNQQRCVGMAANMIGELKRIIVISIGKSILTMFNPQIIRKEKPFSTEEGCLSLKGQRPITRYELIEVIYQDERLRKHKDIFTGWTAQIIQHECDHLEGIII